MRRRSRSGTRRRSAPFVARVGARVSGAMFRAAVGLVVGLLLAMAPAIPASQLTRSWTAPSAAVPPLADPVERSVLLAAPALATPGLLGGGLATQEVRPPAGGFRIHPDRRPFRHDEHAAVSCGDCHRAGERHRAVRQWTARDCEACHHGASLPAGCTACHEPAELGAPRSIATPLSLSVWSEPRVRDLVFDHGRHGEVGCLDCHRGGMWLAAEPCVSCHVEHHRPEAECASCHVAPEPGVHGLAAHLTCGGSGCHSSEATERPVHTRPSCLVCHTEQRDHRPDRPCVACHVKPGPVRPGTEG